MIEVDPAATVHQSTRGDDRARCLHLVVGLGVADALYGPSRTPTDLTEGRLAHSVALGGVLLHCSASGVFGWRGETFDHTGIGAV
jgi:hypothetical protein